MLKSELIDFLSVLYTDVCMVFEVLGKSLLGLLIQSKYRGIHIDNVRHIMRQVRFVRILL